ncbi:hypothetical protein MH117_22140 [Paenibacillus sp. ACRRX]|nr:hypothetical protein [Paenibacillus sp. ACRRX]MCG7410118.1 hypothetical protein [Paenibacillus sp. ACRRX]
MGVSSFIVVQPAYLATGRQLDVRCPNSLIVDWINKPKPTYLEMNIGH